MFIKRFILPFLVALSASAYSGGIKVQTRYEQQTLKGQSDATNLVNQLTLSTKEATVTFEKTDSLFRKWKVTGPGYDGAVELFVSKTRGIGWLFKLGDDSLKAVIARDYRRAGEPGMISLTTNFAAGLFIIENLDPVCNSSFQVYALKNTWDADVEYTGPYALEIESSKPCEDGQWKATAGKLKMIRKIQYATVFIAVQSQNIKHLFKDFTLE